MTWKAGCILAFVLLLLSNGYWLVTLLDSSITYTYQQDSLKSSNENLDLLKEIVPRICSIDNSDRLLIELKEFNNGAHQVMQKGGEVSIDGVSFKISGNKIEELNYY